MIPLKIKIFLIGGIAVMLLKFYKNFNIELFNLNKNIKIINFN